MNSSNEMRSSGPETGNTILPTPKVSLNVSQAGQRMGRKRCRRIALASLGLKLGFGQRLSEGSCVEETLDIVQEEAFDFQSL